MAAPKGNKFALGLTNNGRPPIYSNAEDLNNAMIEYFDSVEPIVDDKGNKTYKYTTTGLALFLGFESRQSLYDYDKKGQDFSYIIKRALLVIENKYEEALSLTSPTGAIFALKNMGWKDKTEVEQNTTHEVKEPKWIVSNFKKDEDSRR